MENTLELRDLIAQSLAGDYEVYPNEAPQGAVYPYAVFEVSTLINDEIPKSGVLEVNVWDRYKTHSRVDSILDKIEKKLKNQNFTSDTVMFRCFSGERQHIIDEDKEIKRSRERFAIRYHERRTE